MTQATSAAPRVRFGVFEVDLRNRELRKQGLRVRLQEKPFQVLEVLLETPGQLVTREKLASRLWPGVYVSFERSLNTAVNSLRRSLCDSRRSPRYIETRAGLGYVFIAPVQHIDIAAGGSLRPETVIPEGAKQDYLRGRWFCDRLSEQDLHRAAAHFESALAQAPRFALASAGLAETLRLFTLLGIRPASEVRERAKQLARSAVEQDSRCAEARVALANVLRCFEWDWFGAEKECRRASELDPRSATVHRARAAHLATIGRFDEALREIRAARELESMSLVIHAEMAWLLCLARDFSAAAEASWQALALEPRFAPAQNTLAIAYQHMGMLDEALVEFRNAAACSDQRPSAVAALANAHAASGDIEEACRLIEQLR